MLALGVRDETVDLMEWWGKALAAERSAADCQRREVRGTVRSGPTMSRWVAAKLAPMYTGRPSTPMGWRASAACGQLT